MSGIGHMPWDGLWDGRQLMVMILGRSGVVWGWLGETTVVEATHPLRAQTKLQTR